MPTKRTKRRTRKLAVPTNPTEVLEKLYAKEEAEDPYVDVERQKITVDDVTISEFGYLTEEMPGCCGVSIISSLDKLAPTNKAAYAAVHALYVNDQCFGRGAATLATTNDEDDTQLATAEFFRANGWKEIPLGENPNSGNQITLWILLHD